MSNRRIKQVRTYAIGPDVSIVVEGVRITLSPETRYFCPDCLKDLALFLGEGLRYALADEGPCEATPRSAADIAVGKARGGSSTIN